MTIRKLFSITIIIVILINSEGCFRKDNIGHENKNNTPPDKKYNEKLPDLGGGSESQNRTDKQPAYTIAKKIYYRGPSNRKFVALTFDDGPDEYYTPQILDTLKKYNVKATFFIIGKRIEVYPEIVVRIKNEGHTIANHTWNHKSLSKLSSGKVREELDKTNSALYTLIGRRTRIFRPPYGAASSNIIQEVTSMGYSIVNWSVDTKDWANTPTPRIMSYVKKEVTPGGIILEHCAGGKGEDLSNTVRALPQIISSLKAQGYEFVKVSELLNIPEYE